MITMAELARALGTEAEGDGGHRQPGPQVRVDAAGLLECLSRVVDQPDDGEPVASGGRAARSGCVARPGAAAPEGRHDCGQWRQPRCSGRSATQQAVRVAHRLRRPGGRPAAASRTRRVRCQTSEDACEEQHARHSNRHRPATHRSRSLPPGGPSPGGPPPCGPSPEPPTAWRRRRRPSSSSSRTCCSGSCSRCRTRTRRCRH